MLSALGCFLLFIGSMGILLGWEKEKKGQIAHLNNFMEFLRKTEYKMAMEKVEMIGYFSHSNPADEVLKVVVQHTAVLLSKRAVINGEEAWNKALELVRKEWKKNNEVYELLKSFGMVFFGQSLEENLKKASLIEESLSEEIRKERDHFEKQRKVVFPVGIFMSMMVMLILL